MDNDKRIEDLKQDIEMWKKLLAAEVEIFERRLKTKSTMKCPDEIREIDKKITESDEAVKRLASQKLLAETRLLRAENGDSV